MENIKAERRIIQKANGAEINERGFCLGFYSLVAARPLHINKDDRIQ
jgi:hypothetical protein